MKLQWLRKHSEKIVQRGRPFIAFQIEPTTRCQLKCVICPKTVYTDDWLIGDMPLSVYEKISRYFHLVQTIHLQGWGEPLLHPNLFEMIQIAKSGNCKTSLTTNGVLLSHDMSEELIRRGVDTVAISIAGATSKTHENIRRGSHFEELIDNIRILANLKFKMRSKTPLLVLSFLMTKTNIKELAEAVRLAKDIGINEFVATNLDYVPTKAQDDMKIFSCNKADINFKNHIHMAKKRAHKLKMPFRDYQLELEEVIVCEMNPLHIVSISFDGCISPCIYLNIPSRGLISRIFCGNHHEIERQCFGNLEGSDFMDIWTGAEYEHFRKAYQNRLNILKKVYSHIGFEMGTFHNLSDIEKSMESELLENPLPEICRSCYKAYHI
jgi:MoaA/NifB/PqqE/SkfB family radical SAM enzyme